MCRWHQPPKCVWNKWFFFIEWHKRIRLRNYELILSHRNIKKKEKHALKCSQMSWNEGKSLKLIWCTHENYHLVRFIQYYIWHFCRWFHRHWQTLSTVKMFSKSFPHSNIIASDAKRCKKITTLHAIGSIKFFKSPKPFQSKGNETHIECDIWVLQLISCVTTFCAMLWLCFFGIFVTFKEIHMKLMLLAPICPTTNCLIYRRDHIFYPTNQHNIVDDGILGEDSTVRCYTC